MKGGKGGRSSTLDIKKLEDDVRDKYVGFRGHRVCHHGPGRGPNAVCCRGFWDEFQAGQLAQRLNFVEFVDVDILKK